MTRIVSESLADLAGGVGTVLERRRQMYAHPIKRRSATTAIAMPM